MIGSFSLLRLPASLLAIAFTGQCLLDAEFLAWLQMMTELAQQHFESVLAADQDAQGKTSLLCRVQNYG